MNKSKLTIAITLAIILITPVMAQDCNRKLDYYVGESMLPTLEPGQNIYWRATKHVEIGDIVIATWPTKEYGKTYYGKRPRYIVHRVWAKTNKGWVLKGDNNPKIDKTLYKYNDIKGVVCDDAKTKKL